MNERELRDICEKYGIDYDELLRDRKEISGGCVYAVEYEDGIVKIGCTANVPRRMYELRHVARGVEHIISKVYVSKCVSNVRKYERDVLHGFAPVLTGRKEFFRIPFESAVNKIKQFCGEECEAYATSIEDILKDEFIRDAVAPDIALQYYKNNRK